MKKILTILVIINFLLLNAQDLSIITNKRMLILDDEKLGEEAYKVHLEYEFNLEGATESSIEWKISGEEKKNWKILSGTLNDKKVDLQFKKIGTYDVSLKIKYTKKVEGSPEKGSVSAKEKKFITVTKNLNNLTNLYSDANNSKKGKWMKLIKKADVMSNKPAFSRDPMPNVYLARGYWGMYLIMSKCIKQK